MIWHLMLWHVLTVVAPEILWIDFLVFEHVEKLDVSIQSVVIV